MKKRFLALLLALVAGLEPLAGGAGCGTGRPDGSDGSDGPDGTLERVQRHLPAAHGHG